MTPLKQYGHMFFHLLFIYEYMATIASTVLALGEILSRCEALKQLRGLENDTRASLDIVVSVKWVKLQFFW